MGARFLGAHMPTGKGLGDAVRRGKEIGCKAVQVFTNSPQQWRAKAITDDMVAAFRAEFDLPVISHDSYLVNLCGPDPDKREQSINGLIAELTRCKTYGIPGAVSHMGAHMGQGEEEGLRIIAESARRVLGETEGTMILMETTAGQGSSLNYRFEHIATLLETVDDPRLQVCLDTCHIYAAGYDLRNDYDGVWAEFDRLVGIKNLRAIHVNDSKKALGSRVDRHEAIGEGELGIEPFRRLVNDPRLEEIPMFLETPEADTMHTVNLQRLRDLI